MKRTALIILTALLTIIFSASTFADHGRGKDKRRGKRSDTHHYNSSKPSKKAHKFVNRHDARDGRWDGRGPKRHR